MHTRDRIIHAAQKLFYAKGIRAVSVDAIAEKAGLTKRSLYYHFKSKDDLMAAYLEARDQPNLRAFQQAFSETPGPLPEKINGIFIAMADLAQSPKWKGCGFLRTAGELADMPGHPAIKAGQRHKKNVENWLTEILRDHQCHTPALTARQILLLLDGAFAASLIHPAPDYILAAGQAAEILVKSCYPDKSA